MSKTLAGTTGTPTPLLGTPNAATGRAKAQTVGHAIAKAEERVDAAKSRLSTVRDRQRATAMRTFANIGAALADTVDLNALNRFELTGLLHRAAQLIATTDARQQLEALGRAEMGKQVRLGEALYILSSSSLDKELRALGMTRASHFYVGCPNLPNLLAVAREHMLTVFRFDENLQQTRYLIDGVDQPDLEHLLREHESRLDVIGKIDPDEATEATDDEEENREIDEETIAASQNVDDDLVLVAPDREPAARKTNSPVRPRGVATADEALV